MLQESGNPHIGKGHIPSALGLSACLVGGGGFQGSRCFKLGRQESGRGMAGISAEGLG